MTKDTAKEYLAVDPIDIPEDLKQHVFSLYRKTYSDLSAQPLLSDPESLLDYNRWVLWCAGKTRPHAHVRAADVQGFMLLKVKSVGLKLCLIGSDGSKAAKRAMLDMVAKSLNLAGVFAEISPPLETAIIKHVPVVEFGDAETVLLRLNKTDVKHTANDHYRRAIGRLGEVEKIMVGKPNL